MEVKVSDVKGDIFGALEREDIVDYVLLSSNALLVPTLPGYLMWLSPIVMRVKLGFLKGKNVHTYLKYVILFLWSLGVSS